MPLLCVAPPQINIVCGANIGSTIGLLRSSTESETFYRLMIYSMKTGLHSKVFLQHINEVRAFIGKNICGVERVKRFANVHLHCIVSSLKKIGKMLTMPPWKTLCNFFYLCN